MGRPTQVQGDVTVSGAIVATIDGERVDVLRLLAEVGKTLPAQTWAAAKATARAGR